MVARLLEVPARAPLLLEEEVEVVRVRDQLERLTPAANQPT